MQALLRGMYGCRVLPLFFFLVLSVLVVRLHFVSVAPDAAWLWDEMYVGDTRSWWKAVLLVGCSLWMPLFAGICRFGSWRPRRRVVPLLLLMAATAAVISAFLSDYPITAWAGYTTQFEGAVVLLGYLVGVWYACEMLDTDASRLFILRTIGVLGLINSVLGIAKGMGWDMRMTEYGRWLMGAGKGDILYRFGGSEMASGTLFQPNHFGMFMAMYSMVALGMLCVEKKRGWFGFWLAGLSGGLLSVIFSQSRAAVGTCVIIAVAWLLLCARGKFRRCATKEAGKNAQRFFSLPRLVCVVGCCALVFLGFSGWVGGAFSRMWERTSFFPAPDERSDSTIELSENRIRVFGDDAVVVLKKSARSEWAAFRLVVGEERGLSATPEKEEAGWTRLRLAGYPDIIFQYQIDGRAVVRYRDVSLDLFSVEREVYAVDYKNRLHDRVMPAPSAGLPIPDSLFSGRGYIWSRALALVPEHPWFGSGPGSFALVFPNSDLIGKQRYLFGADEDKGHGVWLHFLVQMGIIGTLLFFSPFIYVMATAYTRYDASLAPAVLGIAAYAIGSLTNDSTVGVTPAFCVLVGLVASKTAA